jgi:hypothetical protein
MSLFLIGGTNVTFSYRWHKCHAMLLVAQMSHSYYRWHKCCSGRNVMVGEMSGGTNVGGTNVRWDKCRWDKCQSDICRWDKSRATPAGSTLPNGGVCFENWAGASKQKLLLGVGLYINILFVGGSPQPKARRVLRSICTGLFHNEIVK